MILGQWTTNGTFKNNVDTKVETQKLKYDISNIVDSLELMKHFKRVRKGVVQLIKSPPAMETWAQSLGWEDPLKKGKATHSSILAWRIPWCWEELDTTEQLSLHINNLGNDTQKKL